ncbi:MAG: hypothetical protein REH79_03785 [Spiroplasma sp.]|nr:hypothetical protein [Spiroplasma sp.]
MNNIQKYKWNWKKMRRGQGIRIVLPNDFDENGKQKYRLGIIIKSYPSHIRIQLLTTQSGKDDEFSITIDNKVQYIRSIYLRTISLNDLRELWEDSDGKLLRWIKQVFSF